MSRITLTLEDTLAKALRDEAERDDRSMSSVARRAFEKYFGAKAEQKPAKKPVRK